MAKSCFIKVLELSRVSPPPGSVPATSLPVTFFDTYFAACPHMQRLFFYEFPYPTTHFMQNALPNLKNSLSLALQHFFPFAGNHRLPSPPQRPYIYYVDGDSLPFVVAESTAEFKHLIGGNQYVPRRAQELEDLVPVLPPPSTCSDGENGCKQQPLMAIQVTIFPDVGISIGITFVHVAADGRAFAHFSKSWAAISRSMGELTFVKNSPPDYSRDLIPDPQGIWSTFLNDIFEQKSLTRMNPPTDNLRISPVISKCHVETLKHRINRKFTEENKKDQLRSSTFVVTIAFMWVCLVKLHQSNRTPDQLLINDDDHAICHFVFLADCRDRLNLPANYFGNCLRPCIASAKPSEIIGENGIFVAAKAIGREIQEFEEEPVKGVKSWSSRLKEVFNECEHYVTLAGSPKLRVYGTDFGFGRPIKSDVVHIGSQVAISIAESRDAGGVEFGLALPLDELDRFNAFFKEGLLNL